MSTLEKIKHNLGTHKKEIQQKFHIKEIGLFGSYVKGENDRGSDLDILVEFEEAPSLFSFIRLKEYLSTLTGLKVDLVMKQALKPYIGQHILREVVYL